MRLKKIKKRKDKIIPQGCGRTMKWSEMEDVTNMTIEKLKNIEITDYYSGTEKIVDDFQKI